MAPENAGQQKTLITHYVLDHLNLIPEHSISLTNCLLIKNQHLKLMTFVFVVKPCVDRELQ